MISNQQRKRLEKRVRVQKAECCNELLFLSVPLIHIFKWLGSLALHLIH
nr:hypothetical protein P5630_01545 [Bacillus subtilis]